MKKDKSAVLNGGYEDFRQLAAAENGSFSVELLLRPSPYSVLAIHGHGIERGTPGIARAIAGTDLSFYAFNAAFYKSRHLHITSTLFNEPHAMLLVRRTECVIAVHGCLDRDTTCYRVLAGGLNDRLRQAVVRALRAAGFSAIDALTPDDSSFRTVYRGISPANICNLGTSRRGVQLEITRSLRNELWPQDGPTAGSRRLLAGFAGAVRGAITGT